MRIPPLFGAPAPTVGDLFIPRFLNTNAGLIAIDHISHIVFGSDEKGTRCDITMKNGEKISCWHEVKAIMDQLRDSEWALGHLKPNVAGA